MTTRVSTEEIESTRSEKLLAVLMAVFLIVGAVWFYVKVPSWADEVVPRGDDTALVEAQDRQTVAVDAQWNAESAYEDSRAQLDVKSDEYKVAMQEGVDVEAARTEYEQARTVHETAVKELAAAKEAATAAQLEVDEAFADFERENRSGLKAWLVALVRLGFIAGWTFGSYRLIARMRRRESRYLPLAFAGAAVGAIMALVFAVDYVTDYVDPLDLGPFVLSALGIVATVVAFRVLQRHLAARVPGRRVRKGECPFCGFPLREAGLEHGPHCAGCGRDVVAACATCQTPRRVGSPHCAHCGSV